MEDRELEAALDRLEQAVKRTELVQERKAASLDQRLAATRAEATDAMQRLSLLEKRHGDLKEAVAQGLRQVDEILAEISK